MIKNDIINAAAGAAGVDRQKATQAVETIIDVLRQALTRGVGAQWELPGACGA